MVDQRITSLKETQVKFACSSKITNAVGRKTDIKIEHLKESHPEVFRVLKTLG